MKSQKHPAKHPASKKATAHTARTKAAGTKKGLGLTLMAVADSSKRSGGSKSKPSLQSMRIADFYRPLKKPITVRLDVDVLAWFKKDGGRYQSRINQALRKVMEKEIKESGL
ncbi:MAG: BrnA antitoxin family protein [Candidatus Sulfotelmatobacter sp.]